MVLHCPGCSCLLSLYVIVNTSFVLFHCNIVYCQSAQFGSHTQLSTDLPSKDKTSVYNSVLLSIHYAMSVIMAIMITWLNICKNMPYIKMSLRQGGVDFNFGFFPLQT